jgi:hypothetical protein
MDNSSYDFDINNYSDIELFQFFGIPQNSTEGSIVAHIDSVIIKYNIQSPNNDLEYEFLQFLEKSKKKLVNYSKRNPPIQLKPTNYDVIQSQNVIQEANHSVTARKVVPVVNMNSYDFPTGVINPIEKRVITKIINIDSLFRENYDATNSTNFTWILPNPLNNVVSMNIVALELPNVWYTVSSKNNTNKFAIWLYNVAGQADAGRLIELPDGNYMADSFALALNNYFQNAKSGLDFLIASVDPITTRTTIRARDSTVDVPSSPAPYNIADAKYSPNFYFIVQFDNLDISTPPAKIAASNPSNTLNLTNLKTTLGWFMGFRKQSYVVTQIHRFVDNTSYSGKSVTYRGFLQSESSYGSSLHNYVFVEINDYNKNFITDSVVSITNNAYIGNNIIARIHITSGSNNIVFNNTADLIFKMREYLGPVNIKRLAIRLLNKFGEPIDLNNNDFSLALEFKILY